MEPETQNGANHKAKLEGMRCQTADLQMTAADIRQVLGKRTRRINQMVNSELQLQCVIEDTIAPAFQKCKFLR